jgi:hypothetical protein
MTRPHPSQFPLRERRIFRHVVNENLNLYIFLSMIRRKQRLRRTTPPKFPRRA